KAAVQQPFEQVARAVYRVTPQEVAAGVESPRFSKLRLNYDRAARLFKARGWSADVFGSPGASEPPHRQFPAYGMEASFWMSPSDDGRTEPTGAVLFYNCGSGQLDDDEGEEESSDVPLAEVPPVLFSEVMRTIDQVVKAAKA